MNCPKCGIDLDRHSMHSCKAELERLANADDERREYEELLAENAALRTELASYKASAEWCIKFLDKRDWIGVDLVINELRTRAHGKEEVKGD